MHRLRVSNSLMMLLILLMFQFSKAGAQSPPVIAQVPKPPPSEEPKITPQAPSTKGTLPSGAKTPEVRHTVTGQLIRELAIGGETTGWAVVLDEPKQIGGRKLTQIGIDPAGRKVDDFENRRVKIAGILEKRSGIERGEYWVIVVEQISPASNR